MDASCIVGCVWDNEALNPHRLGPTPEASPARMPKSLVREATQAPAGKAESLSSLALLWKSIPSPRPRLLLPGKLTPETRGAFPDRC